MTGRWTHRPEGSNWGEFGDDDQRGRLNLLTPERRLVAAAEVREGIAFCLSLPLHLPGGSVLNPRRQPPAFHPVTRGGLAHFNLALRDVDKDKGESAGLTDVSCDEAVMLY